MSTNPNTMVHQFVAGLKNKQREVQNKAAQDLLLFVKTELREMQQDELNQFFDEFNHMIFDMISSSDVNEKKGGVLAISKIKILYQLVNLIFFHFRMLDQWRRGQHHHENFSLFQQSEKFVPDQRYSNDGIGSKNFS